MGNDRTNLKILQQNPKMWIEYWNKKTNCIVCFYSQIGRKIQKKSKTHLNTSSGDHP
jgi:hypothetical protein